MGAIDSIVVITYVASPVVWRHREWRRGYDGEQRAVIGAPQHFSSTPAGIPGPAPLLGQHTDYVVQELLGLSAAEAQRLGEEGVLT